MRIKFNPIPFDSNCIYQRCVSVEELDVISQVLPSPYMCFDKFNIICIDAFSDYARYDLYVYDLSFERCFVNQTAANCDDSLIKSGVIRVFEINFHFNLNFDFKLFNDQYVDVWNNDINLKAIKPLINAYGENLQMGKLAFSSLATSDFAAMLNLIGHDFVMCRKLDNKLLFAFLIDQHADDNTMSALYKFVDAVYEMVKTTSGRYSYEIPSSNDQIAVNMKDWYDAKRKANHFRKKTYKAI